MYVGYFFFVVVVASKKEDVTPPQIIIICPFILKYIAQQGVETHAKKETLPIILHPVCKNCDWMTQKSLLLI